MPPPSAPPLPLPPLLVLSLSLSQHLLVGPSSITVKLVTISLYSRVSPYLRGSSPPDEDTAGARFYMYVSRARARVHTHTRKRARARRGLKKCVRTHAQVYVYISTRMFPLKNEPVPVPHGRNTARKVSGVTGSIGGLLSINNVIIGC